MASFTYSCGGNTTCMFDGSGSTGATTYAWTYGDGGTASGVTPTHTFAAGNWLVTLTVGNGTATDATSQTVSCSTKGKKVICK